MNPAIIDNSSGRINFLPQLQDQQKTEYSSALNANNDLEAVQTWLAASSGRSKHTFLSYRREASRFLIFLHHNGAVVLSDVKVELVHEYFALLSNPPQHWIIDSNPEPLITQVLKGSLSAQSIAYARTVLSRLYRFLLDAGYVRTNPIALTFKPGYAVAPLHEKALEPDAWVFYWRWLLNQENEAYQRERKLYAARNRWLSALLYHTGLRRSSVAHGSMSGFSRRRIDGRQQWTLTVPSKGGRLHTSIISDLLFKELMHYRQSMGLQGQPQPNENEPLVCNVRNCREAIKERAIGLIFENLTKTAASICEDPHLSAQVERLTAHGLRHTHGTHRFLAGATLESTQASLGHKDPKTTMIYAQVADHTLRDHAHLMDTFLNKINK